MCGIAVAIGWDDAAATVQRLIGGITHRGDISDPVVSPCRNVAMGTRRLRIVDGDHAVQPQASFDGKLLVSFNGEIYNHAALRAELESLGVRFRTASDTEVLANALQVWGPKALSRLIGMFAFVAVDAASGAFLAARDPFGVKPLYLVQAGGGFLFCSEIRPLLEASEGEVLLLPPGYVLTARQCAPFHTTPAPAEEALAGASSPQELDALLAEAVRIRLPDNLPAALMFSGGIDSTLLAHYARRFRPETPGYMLGAPGAPDHAFATQYADETGFDLRILPFDAQGPETLSLIDAIIETVESFEPAVVRGSLCSYLVSRRMHEDGFRVGLCGEGADELFAGYAPLEYAFSLGHAEGCQVRDQTLGFMNRTNLQRVDRCAMRFELEMREPFLDPSIVAHALTLAPAALVATVEGSPRGKMPLRNLYNLYPGELPAAIRDRRKIAFDEGAGLYLRDNASPWAALFEAQISEADLAEGCREFSDFDIASREELFYLRKLAAKMDVTRVPSLRGRMRLRVPVGTPGTAANTLDLAAA